MDKQNSEFFNGDEERYEEVIERCDNLNKLVVGVDKRQRDLIEVQDRKSELIREITELRRRAKEVKVEIDSAFSPLDPNRDFHSTHVELQQEYIRMKDKSMDILDDLEEILKEERKHYIQAGLEIRVFVRTVLNEWSN